MMFHACYIRHDACNSFLSLNVPFFGSLHGNRCCVTLKTCKICRRVNSFLDIYLYDKEIFSFNLLYEFLFWSCKRGKL